MCLLWTTAFSTGLMMVRTIDGKMWLNTAFFFISNILILFVFLNDFLPHVFNKVLKLKKVLKNVLKDRFNAWKAT